jgi:hypothetical protein
MMMMMSLPNLVFSRQGKCGGKICLVLCLNTSAGILLLSSHHNKVLLRVFLLNLVFSEHGRRGKTIESAAL